MINELISYIWMIFFRFLYAPQKAIEGKQSDLVSKLQDPVSLKASEFQSNSSKMSNMQVSIPQSGAVSTGKREEESESVEETTLTEVRKDLGDSKMHQKTATFEGQETTSVVEDHRAQQTEASKSVMQQETTTISANKQVFTSKFESSESFSMEETEEYEVEG